MSSVRVCDSSNGQYGKQWEYRDWVEAIQSCAEASKRLEHKGWATVLDPGYYRNVND